MITLPPTLESMSMLRTSSLFATTFVVGLLALSGCTSTAAGPAPTSTAVRDGRTIASATPAAPTGEVVGTGTVMDVGGDVQFCMGAVAESYPPQCSGVPLAKWSWEGVDGSEQSGTTRWGAYALIGTYDGTTFTVTQDPMTLALYDPMASEDPTGGEPGSTDEETLTAIQEELPSLLGTDGRSYTGSTPVNGYLWVDVVWDDGTLQKAADADFGADVVVIRSTLREIDG